MNNVISIYEAKCQAILAADSQLKYAVAINALSYLSVENIEGLTTEAAAKINEAANFLVESGQVTAVEEISMDIALECLTDIDTDSKIATLMEY